ncbi:MAG: QueT transporter family protein [Clostridiales bacterium]|nr:QueT transporter family protein [Clostridiales bacterium]
MKKTKFLVYGGVQAALYVVLTYAQNLLWPGSTTMAIQMRVSEALCVFACFTPAAIPGLTIGCLLYNVSWAQSLPLDWLVGSLATLFATVCMWLLRKVKIAKCPFPALLMPALWNAPLVGWELTVYLGEGGFTWPVFWLNALYVFLGEAIVLLVLGTILYYALTARGLDKKFF